MLEGCLRRLVGPGYDDLLGMDSDLVLLVARKTDVLTANTDSTSQYSVGLNRLADRLHRDIDGLKGVQSSFGRTLQSELEAFAKRGAQVSCYVSCETRQTSDMTSHDRPSSKTRSSYQRSLFHLPARWTRCDHTYSLRILSRGMGSPHCPLNNMKCNRA